MHIQHTTVPKCVHCAYTVHAHTHLVQWSSYTKQNKYNSRGISWHFLCLSGISIRVPSIRICAIKHYIVSCAFFILSLLSDYFIFFFAIIVISIIFDFDFAFDIDFDFVFLFNPFPLSLVIFLCIHFVFICLCELFFPRHYSFLFSHSLFNCIAMFNSRFAKSSLKQ